MSNKHVKSDLYCPHCYLNLSVFVKSGFLFCPDTYICDYEYDTEKEKDNLIGRKPLTKDVVINIQKEITIRNGINHLLSGTNCLLLHKTKEEILVMVNEILNGVGETK